MDGRIMFLDCPEYLNHNGSRRCGLPAEILERYTLSSTDGPSEGVKISCPRGHWLSGPIEALTLPPAEAMCSPVARTAPGAVSGQAAPTPPAAPEGPVVLPPDR